MTEKSLKQINNSKSQNIQVFTRIRPLNLSEHSQVSCIEAVTDNTLVLKEKQAKEKHCFTFDGIFREEATQQEVYDAIGSEVIESAFLGLNGTIFCYGQTSSGKTYTCLGPDFRDHEKCGILPRLIKETLKKIENSSKHIETKMRISMVEIYNEKIKDLLDSTKTDLKIRSNKKQGIFLEHVTEKYILSEEEAFKHLQTGIENRSVNTTKMNNQSSRSHMLFIIHLNTHDLYTREAKNAKITLVDLAGSEKIAKTGAEGKVLEEAKKINTSLTALGKVINALCDEKCTHVPYRDSKLTRLLQQSLGGNSLTNLIINVSPSSYNESETLTSVRFGFRAKAIKNKAVVNRSYTVEELLKLLEKAEKTIKEQSIIISEFSKKKRAGGYGAVSVPKMITLHLLPDDDENCSSINDQSEPDNEIQCDFRSSTFSQKTMKITQGQRKWNKNSDVQKNQENMKSQTFTNFSAINLKKNAEKCVNFDIKVPSASIHCQESNDFIEQSSENQELSKISIKLNLLQFAPAPQNAKAIAIGNTNKDEGIKKNTMRAIRENLLQLKLINLKERKQNNIKQMIIERKNEIIEREKLKNIR